MLEFIQLLKKRYESVLSASNLEDAVKSNFQCSVDTLQLAESFILKGQLIASLPKHPLQIAIIGPTQAGKSSISNLLLNNSAAGVSPLAGYTVHPQGFCNATKAEQNAWIAEYFQHFQQVSESEQTRAEYQCFSLTNTQKSNNPLPASIVWDTPDFDSIDASGYLQGVLRTIALADVIVLVLSKEKYADQSVWDIMRMIAPLNQPTIIFLNKIPQNSEAVLINSLTEKWRQTRNDSFPEVIPLLYQQKGGLQEWPADQQKRVQKLFKVAEKKSNRRNHKDFESQFLSSHWQSWLEPVNAEHDALKEWQKIIQQCLQEAMQNYERDYLNHPQHYETFQNALAELLTLLEIPGIAAVLASTRKVITWPVRKLYQLGQSKRINLAESSQEVFLLKQSGEHLLISISDKLLDKVDQQPEKSAWWKDLNRLLRAQRGEILQNYYQAVQTYHHNFQYEIEETAHHLYHKLQDQPVTLNSLRATRVTTDAAAVALALKTGGIGLHDLLITPAMLSVTSLLAESAMGSYMARVEVSLKQKQMQSVKQQLFDQALEARLTVLPEQMQHLTQFNIPEHLLHEMEQQLTEKKHGLRLF